MKLHIERRWRLNWFSFERQPTYLHIAIGHPRVHAWWAVSVWVYL